jgi:branched-chain amino acid transport system substrate-binding protein
MWFHIQEEGMYKVRTVIVVLLMLVLVATGVSTSAQMDAPEGAVKIAIFSPITGPAASIGEEILNFATLAVDDFNEATGWSVEIVEADTQLDPAAAVLAAESVIADSDVYGAVGPASSPVVEAVMEDMNAAGIVHVSSAATRTDLTSLGWDTFFRVVPTDAVQGPTDANFTVDVIGATQVFIIDDQTSYAVGLADAYTETLEELGGEVVGRESVSQDDQDFSALVTLIGSSGAEVVFFPGQIASQGALLATQMAEQGVDVQLLGADGFLSSDFIEGAFGATEGAYVSAFAPDVTAIETSADVVERYTEAYGDFGTFGPPAYVATQVVLEAMQRAYEANGELTRDAVRDEVANTDIEVSLLGGPMAFDENGDVLNAAFYMFQVQDEDFVFIPFESASDDMMSDLPAITDIVLGNGDLSTLVAAALAADPALLGVIAGPGPITVFAPSNAGFEAAFADMGMSMSDLSANPALLNALLAYHVVEGTYTAEDLIALDGQTLTTFGGAELSITVVDGIVTLNDSVSVVEADLMASNGVIHIIDYVLVPPEE